MRKLVVVYQHVSYSQSMGKLRDEANRMKAMGTSGQGDEGRFLEIKKPSDATGDREKLPSLVTVPVDRLVACRRGARRRVSAFLPSPAANKGCN